MASKKRAKKQEAEQQEQETAAPEAAVETPKQPSQNGVTRPKSGTATGRVWEISDELSAQAGSPAARADVMKAGEGEGLNSATIATQYGRWRKFHGLGKAAKPAAAEDAAEVEENEVEEVEA